MRREVGAGMTTYLEFLGVMALAKSLLYVPSSLAYLAGELLGALAYRLDRKHREVAKENLQRAFYRPAFPIGNRCAGSLDLHQPPPHRGRSLCFPLGLNKKVH